MTARKDLAQRLAELPAFKLRFGSRVDIFNLPTEDRDLIVRSLKEADELVGKGHDITAEFAKLREKILALTVERDEVDSKLTLANGENAKLEEWRRALAADNARLEEKCRSLAAEHQPLEEKIHSLAAEHHSLEEKIHSLAAEHQSLEEKNRSLAAERRSLEERIGSLTAERQSLEDKIRSLTAENVTLAAEKARRVADQARLVDEAGSLAANLDGVVGLLVRLVNGESDLAAAASVVQAQFPDQAVNLRAPSGKLGGWQPIATAPKDNSLINLIGRVPGGRWVAAVAARRNMISADAGVDQWLEWEHPFAPSHWCPIPAAPSSAEAPASGGSGAATARTPTPDQARMTDDLRFPTKAMAPDARPTTG